MDCLIPLELPDSVPKGVQVYLLDFATALPEQDRLILSQQELEKAQRFHRGDDRLRAICTRASLRRVLAAYLDLSAKELAFVQGPYGKPSLGMASGLEFNVSHSSGYGLIALSMAGPVGIDIEVVQSDQALAELAPLLLGPAETAESLIERWVVKEAALKALGLGITEHLHALAVGPRQEAEYALDDPLGSALRAWALPVPQGYCAALALQPATVLIA
jgi:4'-phosphopantetheinyl transferase